MKKLGSVIEAQQFDWKTLKEVFRIAEEMEKTNQKPVLSGKVVVSLFYESSTRTRMSFEAAAARLGASIISTESARAFSSASKGETLEDTIRVVSGYGDVIILRYDKEGGARRSEKFSCVPIINAGDGTGQHPTQALLDLYTIRKKFGKVEGLTIAMIGDLAHGRTVRSLCYLLAKHAKSMPNNKIFFISPAPVRMRDDIKKYLKQKNVQWEERDSLDDVLSVADIFYQTRVQEERFKENPRMLKEVQKGAKKLVIDENVVRQMKKRAIIMHPLPRVNEITYAVDADPRAHYFEQAKNGLFVRMALLKMILVGY
jgi:aspartate carbamoyltransferase catalytic subunit